MNKHNIWQMRQNRPSLVVEDLEQYAPKEVVYESLLKRGVFKWMACRRDIIKTKNKLRAAVNFANEMIHCYRMLPLKDNDPKFERVKAGKIAYWRGYLKGVQFAYMCIRAICHSERWRAPDNDKKAMKWLEGRNGTH